MSRLIYRTLSRTKPFVYDVDADADSFRIELFRGMWRSGFRDTAEIHGNPDLREHFREYLDWLPER